MKKVLMTGNEAIARGVYEYGTHFASAYPGTPSTEILENISTHYHDVVSEWAPNEKVALEAAVGAAYAGGRAFAAMKHVGINVAADPLFTAAYTGVLGGLILVSADEPGMHSSQNEQDNRNYAKFAKIPMFEPANSQEAKEMIKAAYEVSEEFDTPVLYRLTTRLCHSKGIVELGERENVEIKPYEKDIKKNVAVPGHARLMRHIVEKRTERLLDYSNNTPLNFAEYSDTKIGVIASGVSYEFAKEAFGEEASYLKLGFTWPLPTTIIEEFAKKVDKIYIVEENDPFIEEHVKLMGIECTGKDLFPYYGEMTPDVLEEALTGEKKEVLEVNNDKTISRPPTFCPGCPHRGFFLELGKRKDTVVAGDIGCYALAFTQPYNAIDWILCMGGSFSTGHGAQKVFNQIEGNKKRVVSVLGDSTFFHTGINSLIEVVYNNSNTINVILDNRITGMTGGQDNPGSGFSAMEEVTNVIDIEAMVRACGIKHVRRINPNIKEDVKATLDWAYELDEPSVIITDWPCAIKTIYSDEDKEAYPNVFRTYDVIDHDLCIGCKKCLKTGCPSLMFDAENRKASIDKYTCVGCDVCMHECPVDAIKKGEQ